MEIYHPCKAIVAAAAGEGITLTHVGSKGEVAGAMEKRRSGKGKQRVTTSKSVNSKFEAMSAITGSAEGGCTADMPWPGHGMHLFLGLGSTTHAEPCGKEPGPQWWESFRVDSLFQGSIGLAWCDKRQARPGGLDRNEHIQGEAGRESWTEQFVWYFDCDQVSVRK